MLGEGAVLKWRKNENTTEVTFPKGVKGKYAIALEASG